jgi:hypothetical protein
MEQQHRVQGWIKRNERREVDVAAVAYLPDGTAIDVRLTNISYEGCQLQAKQMLPIGEKLKLALPRLGEVPAQVRWSIGSKAGLYFLLEESVADERRTRFGV